MAKKNKNVAAAGASGEKTRRESIFGSPVRNLLIAAIVSILLGVAFLVEPVLVYTYCGYGIGGLIGLVGLIYIIIYFCRKPVSGDFRYEFGIGLVSLLAGAYVAFGGLLNGTGTSGLGFGLLVKLIGVLIAADGILKLQYSLDVARMRFARWWLVLIVSILGVALGVATVMGYTYDLGSITGLGQKANLTPEQNAFISGMFTLGAAFCLNGLLDLIAMILILVRNHKARREEAIAEGTAMVAAAKQEELASVEYTPAPAPESVSVPAPTVEPPAPAEPVMPAAEAPAEVPAEAPAPAAEPAQAAPIENS